jgi:hypothetical protein
MKYQIKTLLIVALVTLPWILSGCSGSTNSGTSLNLTGLWRIQPVVTSSTVIYVPINATFRQSGKRVDSTRFLEEFPAGVVPCSPPAPPMVPSLSGTVLGNTFNGTVTAPNWTATLSVSGDSTLLTGSFSIEYHSGICSPRIDVGRVTLSKF